MADQSPPSTPTSPPPKSLFCIVILGEILSRKAGLLHLVTGSFADIKISFSSRNQSSTFSNTFVNLSVFKTCDWYVTCRIITITIMIKDDNNSTHYLLETCLQRV